MSKQVNGFNPSNNPVWYMTKEIMDKKFARTRGRELFLALPFLEVSNAEMAAAKKVLRRKMPSKWLKRNNLSVDRAAIVARIRKNMGNWAWSTLRVPEALPPKVMASWLGIALRVELAKYNVPYSGHEDLLALRNTPIDLCIYLLARLVSTCEMNSWRQARYELLNSDGKTPDRQVILRICRGILRELTSKREKLAIARSDNRQETVRGKPKSAKHKRRSSSRGHLYG